MTLRVLKLTPRGVLDSLNRTDGVVWSSNVLRLGQNPIAQLLDSANFVVKQGNGNDLGDAIWQSFDHPCNSFLAGMKLGIDRVKGLDRYLTSWKSTDDPSLGDFTFGLDSMGYLQLILRNRSVVQSSSVPSMLVLNENGMAQRFTWVDRTHDWILYSSAQTDDCDTYALCGGNGNCNIASSPKCMCLTGFVPKHPSDWEFGDWSNGCVRRTKLDCQGGDKFLKYTQVKLPDTRQSWFNKSMNIQECKQTCMRNCSCTAYSNLDIRGQGSGCLLWFGDLMDIRQVSENIQGIYVRMAASEVGTCSNPELLSI
ncbi:G-type lectin S-receptor-like serine/threonine-protein kinase At4g27290 [Eucalyptus grandis]|uniref:G-type lectin S-receptor-like serine/threonine-protein kinase At4g27290 n=1 Tax=Eucalyptus grandis TaxID=71139 RepID=UPI00192E8988|nr:G-type lectin S-receptor-like serine/threonine-protein kinase At4g27290 [Eucalyptus grandis]